ncbi:PPC domain-containing protein [Paracoccus sp. p3-h83]|uniref:PPC domain-containing protein n=1 Tax=Paracoccus sp. p3-h83 TaxID=3342805 RepID=UPI0035B8E3CA
MARSLLIALAAGLCGLTAQTALAADCGGAIRFAAGTDRGSVSGTIAGADLCEYRLSARKGQVMTVALDAPSGFEAIVIDPVEHNFDADGALPLPKDGAYKLRILQTRNSARKHPEARAFTMTVRIAGAAAATKPVTKPAAKPAASAKPAAKPKVAASQAPQCETTDALQAGVTGNYSGSIKGDGMCEYSFAGRKGQTLHMMMDAASEIDAIIYDPVSATLERDGSFTLPQDGTYTVRVLQDRNAARKSTAAKPFSMVLNLD